MVNNYLLVRAMGQSPEELNIFFKNKVVAIGWSKINFAKSSDVVNDVVKKYYSGATIRPQVLGKWKNAIRRFKNIKEEDYIIVPCGNSICLARAKKKEIYSNEHIQWDLANQREVSFFTNKNKEIIRIPRNQLSEGLQRRLRMQGTIIADLSDFKDEIENIFSLKNFDQVYSEQREKEIEKFKISLIKNIQSGKTNLSSGGYGLEKLIQELLSIDGYDARIQSKRKFSGFADADIIAIKEDSIVTTKLLVQIKHHSGKTGSWGAKQLLKILTTSSDYFSEYKLVLITSATPSIELIDICEKNDISLISKIELAEWIFNSIDKLKFETKRCLNIIDVPILL